MYTIVVPRMALVFENFDKNEKSTISVRKKIKTDLKSVGKILSFAPCNDVLGCP